MTTAAALAIAPAIRPTSGNDRATPTDAGGDSFATVLDAEMDATTENVPAAQPAPAAASPTPVKPAAAVIAVIQNTTAGVDGAEASFQAVLANVAPAALNDGEAAVADPAAAQAIATSPTNPAPAAQTAGVAAVLLASAGVVTIDGEATAGDETTEDTSAEGDASATGILAGLETSLAAPAIPTASAATTLVAAETPAKVTAPVGQAGAAQVASPAGETNAALTADASTSQPQAESREQRASATPQASTQPTAQTQTAAATAVDAIAKDAAPAAPSPAPSATPVSANTQTTTDAARVATTPPALQSAPAATIQVYTRIIERADGRAQRFEVRLDPAELGRVDVRIEIGADRKVHAVLAAHDSAALSDLVRGQRALERALSGAGIDLADNGVRFELASDSGRGSAGQQQTNDGNGRSGQSNVWRNFDTVAIPVSEDAAVATVNNSWRPQRLDLVA